MRYGVEEKELSPISWQGPELKQLQIWAIRQPVSVPAMRCRTEV